MIDIYVVAPRCIECGDPEEPATDIVGLNLDETTGYYCFSCWLKMVRELELDYDQAKALAKRRQSERERLFLGYCASST